MYMYSAVRLSGAWLKKKYYYYYYYLRQLKVVARSLSTSAACYSRLLFFSIHWSSSRSPVLPSHGSAALLAGSIPRYGSVSSYVHHTLHVHWLPLQQRILYRLFLSSGKASWVQPLATYAPTLLSLLLLRVAQPSVPLLGVTSWFHLPALLLCSAKHSLLLVQQRGMTCHLSFAYLLVFTRLPSMPYWTLFSMIRPGFRSASE